MALPGSHRLLPLLAAWCAAAACRGADPVATIGYNRDVRPILAENCFACHGPDAKKRKGDLALHQSEAATRALPSGATAVVPGSPDRSAMLLRILSADASERMPPASTGKQLSPAQIATLRAWIAQGAVWQPHWSYIPAQATTPAPMAGDAWSRSPIDRFIGERLIREGLEPSPPADPVTLIRRLSFDLIGLPPTVAEVDAFVNDSAVDAYEKAVDRLLASPHFGERMAVSWLDLVRYADSIGFHSDNTRNVAPYRDWVIQAFNDNEPFDRFTIDQLAGDLLPDATTAQKVASGYNRLNRTTEEGGAQPKEYEAKSAADRVRNVSSVWLGATMGCCECHDHKFDPLPTRDFYALSAFFADLQEAATGPREPGMAVPSAQQSAELARLDAEMAPLRRELDTDTPELAAARAQWERRFVDYAAPTFGPWYAIGPFHAASAPEAFKTAYDPERAVALDQVTAGGLAWTVHADWQDGAIHSLVGDNSATYLYRVIDATAEQPLRLSLGSDDTITVWVNGQQVLAHEVYRGVAPDQEQLTVPLTVGSNALLMKIVNGGGGYGFYFKSADEGAAEIAAIVRVPAEARSEQQRADLAKAYRAVFPALEPVRAHIAELERTRAALTASLPRTLVSTSGPPRAVRIKARGDWMDESGEEVDPAVPRVFGAMQTAGRATRLDLARWLTAQNHPLTARVFVNRMWKMFFGVGIVKTLDDLGSQGETPVHPELLDWLAVDFSSHGWDVKRAIKQLVMSSAYRQSSHGGALMARDPYNRLVARQSRFRIDAEFVRDDALAISGLLAPAIGGRSVKPYQPAGYWMHLNFPPREWQEDQGDDAHRRGLYTFWQRTFLHPSLLAFDASTREECTAERPRSNTPQQALTLLNDPTYVEAARTFAEHAITLGGGSTAERLAWAYRCALSRTPTADEARVLGDLLAKDTAAYAADRPSALKLLAIGQHPLPAGIDLGELAAWTSVTRVILNLHETITRY